MRLSNLGLLAVPAVAYAFLPKSINSPRKLALRSPDPINKEVSAVATSWSQDQQCRSFTQLNMAFENSNPSNIFDGPMALTKERDACGVGFIANTKSGGRLIQSFLQEQ
jgi:glutamate synthase (ferredoxin)